jgi:hypothetical protein
MSPSASSTTKPRNRLLAALSSADLNLLRPYLTPVSLKLRQELEKPNRRINDVYFLDAGIASVVAVQNPAKLVEIGLIGCEGMSGTSVVLGGHSSPLFTGRRQRTAHCSRCTLQGVGSEQDLAHHAAQIRASVHGANRSYCHCQRASQD